MEMDKELIKQLLKALKPSPMSPAITGTTESLPELPSLEAPYQAAEDPEIAQDNGMSLDTKGLNLKSNLAEIIVNHKGLKLDGDGFNGKIGFDGSLGVNANIPIDNGQFGVGYNSKDGNRNFNLNARKRMLGGDIGLDVNNDNGNRRYSLQYQRNF